MNALMMAVWRRQPENTVMVHSDQGSQFSSYDVLQSEAPAQLQQ
jgi:putative transposase